MYVGMYVCRYVCMSIYTNHDLDIYKPPFHSGIFLGDFPVSVDSQRANPI